jgi:hypothetical protein
MTFFCYPWWMNFIHHHPLHPQLICFKRFHSYDSRFHENFYKSFYDLPPLQVTYIDIGIVKCMGNHKRPKHVQCLYEKRGSKRLEIGGCKWTWGSYKIETKFYKIWWLDKDSRIQCQLVKVNLNIKTKFVHWCKIVVGKQSIVTYWWKTMEKSNKLSSIRKLLR